MNHSSVSILSDLTVFMKYAKYIPELTRRETWEELCERNMAMHIRQYPQIKEEIKRVYRQHVIPKKVLPSMRSLQFAGAPIQHAPNRIFNCAYMPAEKVSVFSEAMFLLLGGTGVGYSVQEHHVEKLPPLIGPRGRPRRYMIGDSIEGWADAVKMLCNAYFHGKPLPDFDYSDIRPKGARLVTSGGKAPGPEPLNICLDKLTELFDKALVKGGKGVKLRPIEVHDALCFVADAVLAGGIRRAALISLFSRDDEDMLTCKSAADCAILDFFPMVKKPGMAECVVETVQGDRKTVQLSDWDIKQWEQSGKLQWYILEPQRARANNSAVLERDSINQGEFFDLWQKVEASGSGEPGVYFTHDRDWGTNPCCVSGDTWVMTATGAQKAKDLVNQDFDVFVNGEVYPAAVGGFWETGVKPVYRLTTRRGNEIKLTADHRLKRVTHKTRKALRYEWAELAEIEVGERILLSNHDSATWGDDAMEYVAKGYLLGSLVGDGTFVEPQGKAPRACLDFWGDQAEAVAEIAYDYLKQVCNHRSNLAITKAVSNCGTKQRIASKGLADLAAEYDIVRGNKTITESVERTSSAFHEAFLRGLFDADGGVQGSQEKGVSVRLAQSDLELLKAAQRMLLRLGINSTLYSGRLPEGYRNLPDGSGGLKPFWCRESHELVISGSNLQMFAERVGFAQPDKQQRLLDALSDYQRRLNQDRFDDEVVAIEYIGEEPVYDVTIPGVHEFCANGIQAHNCEIALKPYQFCNLTELNVHDVTNQQDLNERAAAAAFLGTLQAGYTNFHYLNEQWRETTEEEALIGVGMTGIGSGMAHPLDLEEAAEVVKRTNAATAVAIGINPAARTTTVKPAGTSSLVLGSSSGIHAWHNDHYVRRLRVGKNEAIYQYLSERLPALVEDEFMRPHDQAVISIPQMAPRGAILRHESPHALLERVRRWNLEWVRNGHRDGVNSHNVSCTISVKNDEWKMVGRWMWENRDNFNGISVLPYDGGTYKQAPFEDITEERFFELSQHLTELDLTQVIEIEDNTDLTGEVACGAGGCAI